MTWLKGPEPPLTHGCASDRDLKKSLSVCQKTKTAGLLKKCFHILF